ncbi:MAG: methyltransferase domain-containing protein [Anaerolineae bacterium]
MTSAKHNDLDYIYNHWWFASRTLVIDTLMRQALPRHNGLALLDIGCGAGNMIEHLSNYGSVKGIEVDPRPVKEAHLRGYDVDQFDATQPYPFDDGTFDVATALDVIEHVEADLAVLQEAHRVLKPGGHLVVTVPAFMWLWSHNDEINDHKRRYTAAELKSKLRQAGFTVKRMSYNNFFVFPLAAPLIVLRRGNEPQLASHHLQADEYQVEMEPAPPLVNAVLTAVGRVEAAFIRALNFPFGTSLIAVAQK